MDENKMPWLTEWKQSTLTIDDWGTNIRDLISLMENVGWIRPMKLPTRMMSDMGTPFYHSDITKKLIKVLEYYTRARIGGIGCVLERRGFNLVKSTLSSSTERRWLTEDLWGLSSTAIRSIFLIMQEFHDSAETPEKKKHLPTDLNDFFFNPRTGKSWFVVCLGMYLRGERVKKIENTISEQLKLRLDMEYTTAYFVQAFGVEVGHLSRELGNLEKWIPKAYMIILQSQNNGGYSVNEQRHLTWEGNSNVGVFWVIEYLNFLLGGRKDTGIISTEMLKPGNSMLLKFLQYETIDNGMEFNCRYSLLESVQ